MKLVGLNSLTPRSERTEDDSNEDEEGGEAYDHLYLGDREIRLKRDFDWDEVPPVQANIFDDLQWVRPERLFAICKFAMEQHTLAEHHLAQLDKNTQSAEMRKLHHEITHTFAVKDNLNFIGDTSADAQTLTAYIGSHQYYDHERFIDLDVKMNKKTFEDETRKAYLAIGWLQDMAAVKKGYGVDLLDTHGLDTPGRARLKDYLHRKHKHLAMTYSRKLPQKLAYILQKLRREDFVDAETVPLDFFVKGECQLLAMLINFFWLTPVTVFCDIMHIIWMYLSRSVCLPCTAFCSYECPCICYDREWNQDDDDEGELRQYEVYCQAENNEKTELTVDIPPRTKNPWAFFSLTAELYTYPEWATCKWLCCVDCFRCYACCCLVSDNERRDIYRRKMAFKEMEDASNEDIDVELGFVDPPEGLAMLDKEKGAENDNDETTIFDVVKEEEGEESDYADDDYDDCDDLRLQRI